MAVTLSTATEGAVIYYTVNGADPASSGTPYASPIVIDAPKTIRAVAKKSGLADSGTLTAAYSIDSNPEAGDFAYTVSDGKAVITGYTGSAADVVIPGIINGLPVTAIGDGAFQGKHLTRATIPGLVTYIGGGAFGNNPLIAVTIGAGVTLGGGAFPGDLGAVYTNGGRLAGTYLSGNGGATWTVQTPEPVTDFRVEDNARGVTITGYTGSATDILIPGTINGRPVTAIGDGAFNGRQLTSVAIPGGVTAIGNTAFAANRLTSITIPNGVTAIGDYAFQNNQLVSVTIPGSVTAIGVEAFLVNQLTSVTIPDSVASIGNWAFFDNPLTSVTIGAGVTLLGYDSFPRSSFEAAYAEGGAGTYTLNNGNGGNWVKGIQERAGDFWYTISGGKAAITGYEGSGTDVQIPGTTNGQPVTSIGKSAFYNKQLTSVTIPNSVTAIGYQAFYGNPLTSVTIGADINWAMGAATIPGNFDDVYSGAGTYKSSDGGNTWTKQTSGSGGGGESGATDFVAVTSINGVPTGTVAGQALVLSGTVSPANATNKTIGWSVKSAGTTGAVINGNTLTATVAGTVTVTAAVVNGKTASSNYTQDFNITISNIFIPVASISGVPTTGTAGQALTLSGTVSPENATNKTIVWSVKSAGSTGAVINGNTLTAAAGTVTVTAAVVNGKTATSNYTQDFTITFSNSFIPVTSISGVPTTGTAGQALTLSGTVSPENATNKTIGWSVKNAGSTGAVISGNTLTTTAAGTVTVTAAVVNGKTASSNYTQDFNITISNSFIPVTSISGVSTTGTAGVVLTLSGTVSPGNATNKTIAWSVKSAGGTGAVISGNTLTTTAAGTVTVTAVVVNGKTATSNYTQDFNITVLSPQMPADSLAAALTWIKAKAVAGGEYTITLTADEVIAPATLSYDGKAVSITLVGSASERTVSLSSNGSLFTVGSKVTLALGNNVTLRGRSNNAALVKVNSGGVLKMNAGSKITGNSGRGDGGGVYVAGGTLTMSGGTISGNKAYSDSNSYGGGGVCVVGGTFTMSGGTISGNEAYYSKISGTYMPDSGGGVYVSRGTFTMSDNAQINGNKGSGVYVVGGTFTMRGNAQIRGNEGSAGNSGSNIATAGGGGVHIIGSSSVAGTFTMEGGTISGNEAYDAGIGEGGGGVYIGNYGKFTMKGGEIRGNEAWFRGGGVDVRGMFTMEGGEISGNVAPDGGGVYVYDDGTFTKSGGTIYGDTDTTYTAGSTENTATNGNGHAVYVASSPVKKRNKTAGQTEGLNSGTAANWEK
jgi:hypothetical protein